MQPIRVTLPTELPYIIHKLNELGLIGEQLENSSYQSHYKLLNDNPVLVARHFKYKVQVLFIVSYCIW